MKMKQISETTLKITISLDDLEERGMEVHDFLVPKEKTEEFFYTVMDELDLPDNFKNSGMLSFRVTPKKDRVDIFVTKSDLTQELNFGDLTDMGDVSQLSPDELMKKLEETMLAKGDTKAHEMLQQMEAFVSDALEGKETDEATEDEDYQPDYTHYILEFPTLNAVVAFAHSVTLEIESSELYKHGKTYYMTVLINLQHKPKGYANLAYARLLEHAAPGNRTRAFLQEHAIQLLMDKALETLKTANSL